MEQIFLVVLWNMFTMWLR